MSRGAWMNKWHGTSSVDFEAFIGHYVFAVGAALRSSDLFLVSKIYDLANVYQAKYIGDSLGKRWMESIQDVGGQQYPARVSWAMWLSRRVRRLPENYIRCSIYQKHPLSASGDQIKREDLKNVDQYAQEKNIRLMSQKNLTNWWKRRLKIFRCKAETLLR